jgi:hypothetical protein
MVAPMFSPGQVVDWWETFTGVSVHRFLTG